MKVQVFCVIKKILDSLRGKEGVRILRSGNTEVECMLSEVRRNGQRVIYAIEPKHPVTEKHYFELQIMERGERNIGQIVTNFSGKKLNPRWRGKNVVGFRTSKGQLISIIGYAVRGQIEIVSYAFQIEGRTVFLVEEGFGPYQVRNESNGGQTVTLPKELEQLTQAAIVAMEKARCNCFRNGCQYHYALSEEEARQVFAERRERQRAEAEKRKITDQQNNSSVVETAAVEITEASNPVITEEAPKNDKMKESSRKIKKASATVVEEIPETSMAEAMKKAGIVEIKQ